MIVADDLFLFSLAQGRYGIPRLYDDSSAISCAPILVGTLQRRVVGRCKVRTSSSTSVWDPFPRPSCMPGQATLDLDGVELKPQLWYYGGCRKLISRYPWLTHSLTTHSIGVDAFTGNKHCLITITFTVMYAVPEEMHE